MSDTAGVVAVPDTGLFSRVAGVIVSPGRTFATIVAYPRPAIVLAFVCFVIGLATAIPQLTERGRQSLLETQVATLQRMTHQTVTPDVYARMQQSVRYAPYTSFGSVFVSIPVVSLLIAAVFWAIFNAVLGGTAAFKQVLGIVTHAQVIGALGVLVSAPIIWFQGIQSFGGPFNLGALAPMLDPSSAVATFLSGISIFTLWQIVVTAIGLGVLYGRRPRYIASFLIAAYLLLAAGFTALFSSFTGR